MELPISEFKAKCIRLIKTVADNEEELVITLRGKPLAKVTSLAPARQRILGGQPDALTRDTPDGLLLHSDLEDDWAS